MTLKGDDPEWHKLRALLTRTFTITAERARGFSGLTRQQQRVAVDLVHGRNCECLLLRAWVCAAHEIDPERALERNGRLAFSSLQLAQGAYWLSTAVPVDSRELGDPVAALQELVAAARSLSPVRVDSIGATESMLRFFSIYTD